MVQWSTVAALETIRTCEGQTRLKLVRMHVQCNQNLMVLQRSSHPHSVDAQTGEFWMRTTQYRGAFSAPHGMMKCCSGTGRKSVYTTWHFFLCMFATHCANSSALGIVADRKALWHASGSKMIASSHTTPLSLSCRAANQISEHSTTHFPGGHT